MPVVTFTSPTLHRDVRAYATAGDTHTLLSVAEKNGVKLPHDCRDGECGSCLIKVDYVEGKPKMGMALTEKEKDRLKEMGRITQAQIEDAEVRDIPPPYRLACQFVVRDEEIIVTFSGQPGEG
ncbi:Ferredoxin-5 [Rhodovastum atsumiense]|uniref:(2Fe-2S)-binding protein n=1 Tax=Rhodovastum atsumiense TaxID=504468 RepID=A0A5M6IZW3_9PROT|nr:2Fe-2S iron-sulfur cluster-binding protein [Rhodovastum atsumiense]KAA5612888.1 (2Fe-2S)-binding protein [Rhodovastum atsumiense]CAH2601034.1 Ferredoxin-5 [Rhodovastum atsumiense]